MIEDWFKKKFCILNFIQGAHVAGFTGKKVSGINAIVAMDVANPFYSEDKPEERLSSTDA